MCVAPAQRSGSAADRTADRPLQPASPQVRLTSVTLSPPHSRSVQHRLDQPGRREDLPMVGDALFGLDGGHEAIPSNHPYPRVQDLFDQ